MCGICGVVSAGRDPDSLEALVRPMVWALNHRGPDAQGVWSGQGVAMGHTRLSILDLSQAGAQPMISADGRWTISYNGEVYNHAELRQELPSQPFRGHSDTETLLAGLTAWGFVKTLQRARGMFAIAAWDSQERKLYLARDRAGQKPLYYGNIDDLFIFGSELSILRTLPARPSYDLISFALMLRYNNVPAPRTAYQGFSKLPPAHFVVYQPDSGDLDGPKPYWSLPPYASESRPTPASILERLKEAVRLRMLSDVPLGAFLSGGIDSSLVVALMQSQSAQPVKTFTIDFDNQRFSEAAQARAVAQHLGTDHTEHQLTSKQAQEMVTSLGAVCDEPFGDSSLLPTLLLSQMTRKYVTVALTGDGGDELFGGYHRHLWLPKIRSALRLLPAPLRRQAGRALLNPGFRQLSLSLIARLSIPLRTPEEKFDKTARLLLEPSDLESLYRSAISQIRDPNQLLAHKVSNFMPEMTSNSGDLSDFDRLCRADFNFYMPNDVLVKVDRASMHCGLEARSPFMDHLLIEQAFQLEKHHKVRGGRGKTILRSFLADYLPSSLIDQPKMGFAVPIADWLRGDLKDWAGDLLSSSQASDLFVGKELDSLWHDHQGGRDRQHELWNVLMLLSWIENSGAFA